MAELERLDALTRMRNLQEYFRTVFPDQEIEDLAHFQRLLLSRMVRELTDLRAGTSGAASEVLHWGLIRLQAEDLKVLMRIALKRPVLPDPMQYLVALPPDLELKTQELAGAESIEDFIRFAPRGIFRTALRKVLEIYAESPLPIFFESALDRAYFEGILGAVEKLTQEDRDMIRPMVCQEADIFHLMVALRGRFHYGLTPDMLLPFHVPGGRIPEALYAAMLDDPDPGTATARVAGYVLDGGHYGGEPDEGGPAATLDMAAVERLAWARFLRLSNLAFRKSHIGLGTVAGFVGLRRVETANLITVAEGIARRMDGQVIRDHVITGPPREAAYV